MTQETHAPTSDESLLAAIAHFLGLLVAFIIWVTQKDKSRYVRFQAMQAIVFDLVIGLGIILFSVVSSALIFGALALGIGDIAIFGSQGNPTAEAVRVGVALMTAVPLILACIFIPIMIAILILRLVASIQTLQGKDFRYPWLGKLVENHLVQESAPVSPG